MKNENSYKRVNLIRTIIVQANIVHNYEDVLGKTIDGYVDYCLKNNDISITECSYFARKIEASFIDLLTEFYGFQLFIEKDDDELEMISILLSTDIDTLSDSKKELFEDAKRAFLCSPLSRKLKSFNVASDRSFQERLAQIVKTFCSEISSRVIQLKTVH